MSWLCSSRFTPVEMKPETRPMKCYTTSLAGLTTPFLLKDIVKTIDLLYGAHICSCSGFLPQQAKYQAGVEVPLETQGGLPSDLMTSCG